MQLSYHCKWNRLILIITGLDYHKNKSTNIPTELRVLGLLSRKIVGSQGGDRKSSSLRMCALPFTLLTNQSIRKSSIGRNRGLISVPWSRIRNTLETWELGEGSCTLAHEPNAELKGGREQGRGCSQALPFVRHQVSNPRRERKHGEREACNFHGSWEDRSLRAEETSRGRFDVVSGCVRRRGLCGTE